MKYLFVLMLVTFSFGQQKEQRYQIYNLGEVGGIAQKFMLDTQTGRTWHLIQDSTISRTSPIWKEIVFLRSYDPTGEDSLVISNTPKPPIKLKK